MKRSEHFFEATKEGFDVRTLRTFGRAQSQDTRAQSPEPRESPEPAQQSPDPRSHQRGQRPNRKSIASSNTYVQMTLKLCFVNLASGIGTSYVQDDANQKIESKQVFRRACFIRHLKRTHPTLQTRFVRPRRS